MKYLKLSLLVLTTLMVGCNEKVSPELEQSNVTTPTTSTPVPPTEYYFSVTNASPTILNYRLHKTGAGNATKACEIRNTTGLSNDNFRGDQASNDITCFFEAEELTLYHGGFDIQVNSSKNTCDYVAYTPFGFYDRIPGDSTATYYQVSCMNDTTTSTHARLAATALDQDTRDNTGTGIGCNEWIIHDSYIPQATRQKFTLKDDADLCAFDYTKRRGENCDIGLITIKEIQVTYTPASATRKEEIIEREVDCGGTVHACVKGPTKTLRNDATFFTEVSDTSLNTDFSLKYSYPGLLGQRASVKSYANYRRDLASKEIDYGTSAGLLGSYRGVWADPTFGRTFDPSVLDFFSNNLMLDNNTPLIDDTRWDAEAIKSNRYSRRPLAADPYLGLSNRVNPFYTFYCLDTAMDIKARIRVMVREWDRIFPTTTTGIANLELLSDLNSGISARQDNPLGVEIPGDNDIFIPYSDLGDWDDLVKMSRTPGVFDPTDTVWSPAPSGSYTDGWFNPSYFTNGNY